MKSIVSTLLTIAAAAVLTVGCMSCAEHATLSQSEETDGAEMSFMCKNAVASRNQGAINTHCNDNDGLDFMCKNAIASGRRGAINTHCGHGDGGLSFMCKNAIARGNRSAINVHCD